MSKFPLLPYAASSWHDHALSSLSEIRLPLTSTEFSACPDFFALLSHFLLNRKVVTTWVEACGLGGVIPCLDYLVGPLSRLGSHHLAPGPARREFLWMIEGVRQLAMALRHLDRTHADLFLSNPATIWSSSIRTTVDDELWSRWEPPVHKDKVSDDGMEIRVENGGIASFIGSH